MGEGRKRKQSWAQTFKSKGEREKEKSCSNPFSSAGEGTKETNLVPYAGKEKG